MPEIRALTFDVFGTVVDWRSSIIRDGMALGAARALDRDWASFADDWRGGYAPILSRVRQEKLPWMKLDELHRMLLDELLEKFEIAELPENQIDHLNRVWHRLDAWPDVHEGLGRLKPHYVLATLSNGNVSLLTNMAKYAGLSWDCILSSELAKRYKPDPEVYEMAADLLGLQPQQIMMVTAHGEDLEAARRVGFRTALVRRPLEYGPDSDVPPEPDHSYDVVAGDLVELAERLGGKSGEKPITNNQ